MLALAGAVSFSNALAHDPFENLPKQAGLLVEYFEVEHGALPPLLRDYEAEADATELMGRVQESACSASSRRQNSWRSATPI